MAERKTFSNTTPYNNANAAPNPANILVFPNMSYVVA